MVRIHLFEWEDQAWCPALFRNFITEHLQFLARFAGLFVPVADKLHQIMSEQGETRVVDMCSGGGGPWPGLLPYFQQKFAWQPQVTLTDLYPNAEAFERIEESTGGRIQGHREPVSAFDAPANLEGFRTIFTGFHHFRPEHARKILEDAVNKRVGIGIFESQERHWLTILLVPPAVFFAGLLFTPFIGQVTLKRLLFTYVIPICPLLFAWDGFVSCLRTYSPEELQQLTLGLASEDYEFEIGQLSRRLFYISPEIRITYLIGKPVS
jgi:hypothetical protein